MFPLFIMILIKKGIFFGQTQRLLLHSPTCKEKIKIIIFFFWNGFNIGKDHYLE